MRLLVDLVEVAAVDQLTGLSGNGAREGVLAVPQGAGGKPGAEVEIALSVFVPEECSLAPHRCHRELGVGREDVVSEFVGCGHEASGSKVRNCGAGAVREGRRDATA
mgnify:CR=1 FL=1